MGLTQNLGRLSPSIFSDSSLNIGVGAAPSGTYKFEVTGTSKVSGVLTLGATLSNGTYTYTLPAATGTLALVGGSGVGTVTSVSALTIGTSGTDLSSSVANSTTTPVITLNVPTASAANRGALSAADWTTFNNKQATLSLTTTGSSGAATLVSNVLNVPNYGSALSGYLPLSAGASYPLTGTLVGLQQIWNRANNTSDSLTYYQTAGVTKFRIGLASGSDNFRIYSDVTGSNAFTINSTSDLVTLTGALNGTSATFSSSVQVNGAATGTPLGVKTATNQNWRLLDNSGAQFDCVNDALSARVDFRIQGDNYFFGSGRVGLGQSTDSGYKLDVNGTGRFSGDVTMSASSGVRILSVSTGGVEGRITATSGAWYIGSQSAVPTVIVSAGTTALTIATTGAATFSGSVGIGIAPANKLDVSGTIRAMGYDGAGTGAGLELFYLGGISYVSSQDRATGYVPLYIRSSATTFTNGNVNITGTLNGTSATFTTTSGSGVNIVTNDIVTLKMNTSVGTTKNWGFATTNLAASDFGIYQSTSNGGDAITAGTAKLYFSGTGAATFSSSIASSISGSGDNGFLLATGTGTGARYSYIANDGAAAIFGIEKAAGGAILGGSSAYATVLYSNNATSLQLGTNQLVRMTITSGGNVGIGTNSPGDKLAVESVGTGGININNSTASGENYIRFKSVGVLKTQLTSNYGDGNLYIYHGGVNAVVVGNTGAATFSSSVTAQGYFALTTTSNAYATQGTLSWNDTRGTVISGKTASIFDFAVYGAAAQALIINPTGTSVIAFTSGNVGIGTSSPSNQLTIKPNAYDSNAMVITRYDSDGYQAVTLGTENTANGFILLKNSSNTSTVKLSTSGVSYFNGGNVLIGTSTDYGYKFVTNGEISSVTPSGTKAIVSIFQVGWNKWNFQMPANSTDLQIDENGSPRMTVKSSGNVGIGTTTPEVSFVVKGASIGSGGKASFYGGGDENNWSAANNEAIRIGRADIANAYYSSIWSASGSSGNESLHWLKYYISNGSNGQTLACTMFGNGNVAVAGALSKGSGSFRIKHPLESMTETHQLVHSFIEGPQADLIYRGKLNLINGKAEANIDVVSTMTNGTFEALCREVQCFTTNESGWDLVKGKVIGNIIYIESQNPNSTDEISWMVIGERKDKHMMDTEWTDENGRVIVEPLKPIETTESIT